MIGTVFVVQQPMRKDRVTGEWAASVDVTPASIYGRLEVLLTHDVPVLTPGPTVALLKRKLKDFNDKDYLLALGDPSAIAMAAAVASQVNHGRVNLLKWDKHTRQYIEVKFLL